MQNTKKPKDTLDTLFSKHVYFSLGEKNDRTDNNNAKHKKAKRSSGNLNHQTCILHTWGEKRKYLMQNRTKTKKTLETLFSKHVYFSLGEKNERTKQQQCKAQESQKNLFETLISKHIYFSLGEKNEK